MSCNKLVYCQWRIKFDEIGHTKFNIETCGFLLKHEAKDIVVAEIINFWDKF